MTVEEKAIVAMKAVGSGLVGKGIEIYVMKSINEQEILDELDFLVKHGCS